jgi:predicted nucleic acid-binding protein
MSLPGWFLPFGIHNDFRRSSSCASQLRQKDVPSVVSSLIHDWMNERNGYVDTSVLAAYYFPEPLSLAVEHTLRNLSSLMSSELTPVEFASAISRKVREMTLSRESAARLIAQFEAHLADGYYEILSLKAHDYHLAQSWLRPLTGTLRTLDVLHLL